MVTDKKVVPLVKHYRLAERELSAWALEGGKPVTTSNLDMHVASQLLGVSYANLDKMTFRQYKPYADVISAATYPEFVRVMGTGPWKLVPLGDPYQPCQIDCGLICTCPFSPSEIEFLDTDIGAIEFREMLTEDYHAVAPYNIMDQYALAERLLGKKIDEMPQSLFRTVSVAIQRSFNDPFWPTPTTTTTESP